VAHELHLSHQHILTGLQRILNLKQATYDISLFIHISHTYHFNPFSPNRAIKCTSVYSCVLTALQVAVGFNDQIEVIYLYRGTERVN